jgi:hypothetical protein
MTRVRHSANPQRPAARLLSTPTTEESFMATTTIEGVRFSDTLAALLDHAAAQTGWRVERDTRGRNAKGVLVYPADPAFGPFTVEERGAKFNRGHYDNLRRELYRAGLPPLPGDGPALLDALEAPEHVVMAPSKAAALKGMPKGTVAAEIMPGVGFARTPELDRIFNDPDAAPKFVASMTEGLAVQAGVGKMEADLLAAIVQITTDWALINGKDRLAETAERVRAELAAEYDGQVRDALAMVEEAEARAERAEKALAKAEAAGSETGRMLTDALARAEAAEAEARRLNAALAPLRAVLSDAKV